MVFLLPGPGLPHSHSTVRTGVAGNRRAKQLRLQGSGGRVGGPAGRCCQDAAAEPGRPRMGRRADRQRGHRSAWARKVVAGRQDGHRLGVPSLPSPSLPQNPTAIICNRTFFVCFFKEVKKTVTHPLRVERLLLPMCAE